MTRWPLILTGWRPLLPFLQLPNRQVTQLSRMPGMLTSRRDVCLAVVVLCALVAGGRGGQSETSTAAATSSTSAAAASTTRSATTLTAGPMTGEELVWLEAISKLHREIDEVLVNSPTNMTAATLRALANDLRDCGRELARLGVPSDRLQPVYSLAKRGCVQYDKGAQCLATAAAVPAPVPGTAAERTVKQALDCGSSLPGRAACSWPKRRGRASRSKRRPDSLGFSVAACSPDDQEG